VIVVSAAIQRREKTKSLLRQVAVLAPLSDLEMLTLADSFAEETYADGYTVCKQGEDGNDFYLIKEGLAMCYQDDDETGEEVHFLRHRTLFVLNLTI
jgi:cAMP-dependent protein kinase regulator